MSGLGNLSPVGFGLGLGFRGLGFRGLGVQGLGFRGLGFRVLPRPERTYRFKAFYYTEIIIGNPKKADSLGSR